MTTSVCPSCGAQYLADKERCVDCDVALEQVPDEQVEAEPLAAEPESTEEAPDDGAATDDPSVVDTVARPKGFDELDSDVQIAYELDEWGNESKVALDGVLTQQTIPHVWEAGTLVIRIADEERVDELVEQFEIAQQPTLDPDADQVVYEVDTFDDSMRASLEAALVADDIAYGWDEDGNLVVLEADEARVEPILDRIDQKAAVGLDDDPADESDDSSDEDSDGEADDDGLVAQEVMSTMFVAADKLMKDPTDPDDAESLAGGRARATGIALPYGFSSEDWQAILAQADKLSGLLAADDLDEPAARDAARSLRETLHQYV